LIACGTRNGRNVTAPKASSRSPVVLDGELVARQGRPFEFYGLARGCQPARRPPWHVA
jgi:hypothetical protein